ncbi:MAG TPA: type II and III secretion system protein [Elusimicrobiota bacterium]|nr:type II and III secretion system protein [Elusimicrobiota bacterium]
MRHYLLAAIESWTRRLLVCGLCVALVAASSPAPAAPIPDDKAKSAADAVPSNAKGAPMPPGAKEPMIEVSVDTLEISETNTNVLGILWGDKTSGSLQAGQLNFVEQTVPALFNIGTLNRDAISGTLDALITNNQARILANPTLLTKSGFEANFLVGGEIPYPTVGQGGVGGVEFKKYGVSLKILPQLTPRHTIDAQINVGVSNPDSSVSITLNNVSVPGLSSREAGSKVEVNDGETVVLAGIKQSRREKVINKVPVLGYIPILGLLFTHKSENVVQTSLVLFVTFRLVP